MKKDKVYTNKISNIFFVHTGNSNYLKHSLNQAKKKNKNAKIILLGDKKNNCYEGIQHVDINNYSEYANKLDEYYIHLSDKEYTYELFCIKRWFIIYEYMKKNNIFIGYYQDSDVILDYDIESLEYDNKYWYCDCSGHVSAFNVNILGELCSFIMKCYTDKKLLQDLINMRINMKRNGKAGEWANITDMELISLFVYNNEEICKNIGIRNKNMIMGFNIYAEDHINALHMNQYEKKFDKTNIYCINNKLYVKDSILNKLVRVLSIHFHTKSKMYIEKFIDYDMCDNQEIYYYDFNNEKWIVYEDRKDIINYKVQYEIVKGCKKNEINLIYKEIADSIESDYLENRIKEIIKDSFYKMYNKVPGRKIVGWATGNGINILNKYINLEYYYFVDKCKDKIGRKFNGAKIYDIEKIFNDGKNRIFVVVLTMKYYDQVKCTLEEHGFKENYDFVGIYNIIGYYNRNIDA